MDSLYGFKCNRFRNTRQTVISGTPQDSTRQSITNYRTNLIPWPRPSNPPNNHYSSRLHNTTLTLAPAIILVFIAVPSLLPLYLIDEIHNPTLTLKTIGHQRNTNHNHRSRTGSGFPSNATQFQYLFTILFNNSYMFRLHDHLQADISAWRLSYNGNM
jgi:hypothetical protein